MLKRLAFSLFALFWASVAVASGITSPSNYNAANVAITGGNIAGVSSVAATSTISNTGVNAAFEHGSTSVVNTPFIDFHSSGNNIDYDTRILASGGTGAIGTGILTFTASSVRMFSTSLSSNLSFSSGKIITVNAAPTIASGFGTGASIVSANGTAAFIVNVGTTTGTNNNGFVTMPAATTGWICSGTNINAPNWGYGIQILPVSTTSIKIVSFAYYATTTVFPFQTGALIAVQCTGY